jgi:hypothetical protein
MFGTEQYKVFIGEVFIGELSFDKRMALNYFI